MQYCVVSVHTATGNASRVSTYFDTWGQADTILQTHLQHASSARTYSLHVGSRADDRYTIHPTDPDAATAADDAQKRRA